MQKISNHIQISLPEVFSRDKIDENITPFKEAGIELNINLYPIRAYASIEWSIPTAVTVLIFSTLFNSMISELGIDIYTTIKKAFQKWFSQGECLKTSKTTASGVVNAKTQHYTQSLYHSIKVQCKNDRFITLLFDVDLDQKHWLNATSELLDLFKEYYVKDGDSKLDRILEELSDKKYHQLYAIIDKQTKKLEFHDDNTILKKFLGIDMVDPD